MDFRDLRSYQESLARKAVFEDGPERVTLVAGVDVAYSKKGPWAYPALVLFSWPDLEELDWKGQRSRVEVPYVPGFLSFREVPLLTPLFEALPQKPDLVFVDGQGKAHPRRAGLAVHLGVVLGLPTIGCAKKPLVGEYELPPDQPGAASPLCEGPELLGYVLRSRKGVKPIFVSPGHLISPEKALEYTRKALRGFRLPEPVRRAHLWASALRKEDG